MHEFQTSNILADIRPPDMLDNMKSDWQLLDTQWSDKLMLDKQQFDKL
jgi:hypothetical protein